MARTVGIRTSNLFKRSHVSMIAGAAAWCIRLAWLARCSVAAEYLTFGRPEVRVPGKNDERRKNKSRSCSSPIADKCIPDFVDASGACYSQFTVSTWCACS
jgi:hypothetical protein